jgi:hypothetical protein
MIRKRICSKRTANTIKVATIAARTNVSTKIQQELKAADRHGLGNSSNLTFLRRWHVCTVYWLSIKKNLYKKELVIL